jgi:Ca2+-transporting ATPase
MGCDGTDAAREAGSVVLTDDRFASLAEAIRESRGVESNLRKGIRYYFAAKVVLVAIMLLPALLGPSPPLSPAMIILVELFILIFAMSVSECHR